MTERQSSNQSSRREIDEALAPFIADVLELAGLFRRAAQDIAREAGQTQAGWYALSVFSQEPMTVSRAARRLGTSRQAVHRTTNELLTAGLITTEENPDHRTSPIVRLTPHGHDVLRRISETASRSRRQWFSDNDAPKLETAHAEITQLRDILRQFTDPTPRAAAATNISIHRDCRNVADVEVQRLRRNARLVSTRSFDPASPGARRSDMGAATRASADQTRGQGPTGRNPD